MANAFKNAQRQMCQVPPNVPGEVPISYVRHCKPILCLALLKFGTHQSLEKLIISLAALRECCLYKDHSIHRDWRVAAAHKRRAGCSVVPYRGDKEARGGDFRQPST